MIGAVVIAMAGLGFFLGAIGPTVILLARDLAVERGDLAWLSAGFGGALLAAGLVGPWLLRLGPARVLRLAAAGLAAGLGLLALAPSPPLVVGGALLAGAGGAALVLVCPTLLTGGDLAARLAGANAAASAAGIAAPLLLGALDLALGRGRLALLVPLPALAWVASRALTAPAAARAVGPRSSPSWRRVAARVGAVVLAVAVEFAFVVWGAARLEDSGLPTATAAGMAVGFPLGMAVGRLVGARTAGGPIVLRLGALGAASGAAIVAAASGPTLICGGMALAGLGTAVLYPLTLAALVERAGLPPDRAAALGCVASGTAVSGAPLALAALAAATSLRVGFAAVIPLVALVIVLAERRDASDAT